MAPTKPVTPHSQTHRICNVVPSRNIELDWKIADAIAANAVDITAAGPLPASFDLRQPWWDIGDQEATGSCVGWASTDSVMRYHMVKTGKLPQANGRLSPRYTWMASKENDVFTARPTTFIEGGGTSLKAAMDILRKFGAVPESLLPFHIETNMYLGSENAFFATAAMRRITSYFNLAKNFASWRSWLVNQGPIMVGLSVDSTWDNATQTNGKLDIFHANTVRGGHAVCVVGYTNDNRFIVRNSWGKNWGDQGFAYASEAYINAAFFNESYGVTV